jgi:hypothetical protein
MALLMARTEASMYGFTFLSSAARQKPKNARIGGPFLL